MSYTKGVKSTVFVIQGAHLVVAIAGDLDARLPHLHVHNQAFHRRQRVLVVTKVLRERKLEERIKSETQIGGNCV